MVTVPAIFDALSDTDLKAIILDLETLSVTGILPAGAARALIGRLVDTAGIPHNDAFHVVQRESVLRAAFKWARS